MLAARSGTRLAVRYLDDTIVLSKTHAWTYVELPGTQYEFLPDATRISLAERIMVSLSSLLSDSSSTVDCHLIVTSKPFDVQGWEQQVNNRVSRYGVQPAWNPYISAMSRHLHDQDYQEKRVYLGVCLGPRERLNFSDLNLTSLWNKVKTLAPSMLMVEDHAVDPAEIQRWTVQAQAIRTALGNSHLHARSIDSAEVAWLISKPLWPGIDCPEATSSDREVWGSGEIEMLTEGVVKNGYRHLEITQASPGTGEDVTGYVATLAVARFPEVMHFPEHEPWLHYAASLPFQVDQSVRFTLVPHQKAHKDVSKTLTAAQDQAMHIAEGGLSVPMQVREQLVTAENLQHSIRKNQTPWLYARYHMTVTADSEEQLRDRVRHLTDHYRDLGIDLTWPSGDQLDLLLESMPGERARSSAYLQRQEIPVLAGGMPTATSEVGDTITRDGAGWKGCYLGDTTSRMRLPVFFSPHVAMAQNSPPGTAILGTPGSGKSFLAFSLAYQAAASGVWTILIDPKADSKPLANLPGLGARVFDLRQGADGLLDPFAMGDSLHQSKILALETLRLLLGGVHMSEDREAALIAAVDAVSATPSPSLRAVVDWLIVHPEKAAQNLGSMLRTLSELEFARLCFAPNGGQRLNPEDGLTVVTLLGLTLPAANASPEHYSYEERLAVSTMYLISRYARKLMLSLDKSHPKAIFIDEAWAITSTPQGAKMIPETIRMGRSHNTSLVLVSQNAQDLMDEQITNSLSSVFAFRSRDLTEIDAVLRLLGTDATDEHRAAVRDLFNGECLMRDPSGRIARVQVQAWEPKLWETFNTNPDTRGQQAAAAMVAA